MADIKKNLMYQMVFRIITILTPLITNPILSRALGADNLGIYSATLAYVNYFVLFAMLGIENHGMRSIAAVQNNRAKVQTLFWNIYTLQVIVSLVVIAAYAVSFLFIDEQRIVISLLQGVWLLGSLFNVNWFFFGKEQFKLIVSRNIIIKLITVLLIVLFIRTRDDLYLYTIIMSADALLSNLIILPFLKKHISFEKPQKKLMLENLKPVLILFIPLLAMSVFHLMDKSMLDILSTEENVGYYYSTDKIINIPLAGITALSTVMLPRISNEYANKKNDRIHEILRKSTELSLFFDCAVGFGVAAIARNFIPLFFGDGFDPCIELVYWFVPILFIKSIGELIRTQYLVPVKRDKLFTAAVVCGAVTNVIANLILIPKFDALGAVLGTMIAEFVVMFIEIVFTLKDMPFIRFVARNWMYIVFGVVMLLGVWNITNTLDASLLIKTLIQILVGGVIYMTFCIIYWGINKNSAFHGTLSSLFKKLTGK